MRRVAQPAGFALLRCPVCEGGFSLTERRLICVKGHSFDLAKSGYVNLMTARRHVPAGGGDTCHQLASRARFLSKGHFDRIADTIAAAVSDADTVLDAGCGTGFHLARIVKRLGSPRAAGIDLSKDAAAWSARRHTDLAFAVADIWGCWPIHDRSLDLVTSIFAPKNYAEMARVLRPGGVLALVFPGAQHLQELRRTFGLLDVRADKAEAYLARMARDFSDFAQRRMAWRVTLERGDILDAILMGPSVRHQLDLQPARVPDRMDVTIDVEFLFARRRR